MIGFDDSADRPVFVTATNDIHTHHLLPMLIRRFVFNTDFLGMRTVFFGDHRYLKMMGNGAILFRKFADALLDLIDRFGTSGFGNPRIQGLSSRSILFSLFVHDGSFFFFLIRTENTDFLFSIIRR